MKYTNRKIYDLLFNEKENILDFTKPNWYRWIRYEFPFSLLLIYSEKGFNKSCIPAIRETDSFAVFDNKIACIVLEAIDGMEALEFTDRVLEGIVSYDHSNVYYASLTWSSQSKISMEDIVEKNFMILEYAVEYERTNEVLNFEDLHEL